MVFDPISVLTILVSVIVWSIISYEMNNASSQTSGVNWIAVLAYILVGFFVYATGILGGTPITFTAFLTQMVGEVGVIAAVDMFITNLYTALEGKTSTKTLAKRMSLIFPLDPHYTGHNFEPVFTIKKNDGTVQVFNTPATGICCSIIISKALAAFGWSSGFKVTPAFSNAVSPGEIALIITAGFNSDNTPIMSAMVDPNDGGPVETVALALDKTGTPSGIWRHTYAVA